MILGDFITNHRNADVCARVKESWKQRNIPPPPNQATAHRPRIVMAYVDRTGLTASQLVDEYDWDYFMTRELPAGEPHA